METPNTDPFSPEGVVFLPVSAALARARILMLFLVAGVVVIVEEALFFFWIPSSVRSEWWYWLLVGFALLDFLWTLVIIPRQVRAMGYAQTEQDFLFRRGILFRSLVAVPYGRMQYVDVSDGPLARYFGIAEVSLYTASVATDASIPGLPKAEAAKLRITLTARGEAHLAGL